MAASIARNPVAATATKLVTSMVIFQILLYDFGAVTHAAQENKKYEATSNERMLNTKGAGLQNMKKTREHIGKTLGLKAKSEGRSEMLEQDKIMKETLQNLLSIYETSIKNLEVVYRFSDLNKDALLEAEIKAKPMILFVGPWSTGKTTFINYLLGLEEIPTKLQTGAQPTTSEFSVIQYGAKYKTVKGMQLVTDSNKAFASLEKMGLGFIERLQGIEMPSPLLEVVDIVDTPGIIENKKQQERGYPFNDVMQWFLQRASIIFLMFDPTKLEVGSELEVVFKQLKGHFGKVKILMNKADTIKQQELMRVYGSLFWSLAPLVTAVEPPRVYVGSFWSDSKADHPMAELFLEEEIALLADLNQAIENQVENKIAYVRRHAFLVRLHALTVDRFIEVFHGQKSYFKNNDNVWREILYHPGKYGVFQNLLRHSDISKHDLPRAETYVEFFSSNSIEAFSPLTSHCYFFSGCDMDHLAKAIAFDLPKLLNQFKVKMNAPFCTKQSCN